MFSKNSDRNRLIHLGMDDAYGKHGLCPAFRFSDLFLELMFIEKALQASTMLKQQVRCISRRRCIPFKPYLRLSLSAQMNANGHKGKLCFPFRIAFSVAMEKTRDKQTSSSKTSRSQTPPWRKSNKNTHLQSQSDWNDHERSDRSGRNDHNDVWNHTRDAGKGKGSERHDDWNSRSHDRSGGGMSGWDGGGSAGKSHDDARRKQHWNDHQRSDRNRWYDWNNNRDTGSRRWHDDRGGSSRGGDIEERNKLSVKQFAMDVDEEEDKPPAEVVQKQLQRRAARQLLRFILAESCMK